jgi:antitoxin (DNA-binding transcriptional repressor) of toxin-antitoxin stability system
MKVNVQYAESHLADLISAASRGEVVEIEGEESTAQILAFPKPKLGGITGRRVLGAGRGEVRVPSIEEWKAVDKELLEAMMADSPISPVETR